MNKENQYDVEEAQKLLQNIEILGDIRKVRVPDFESRSLEQISLKDWISKLHKRVEIRGSFGLEKDFVFVIQNLDNNAQLVVSRAEEGVRRLLNVIEKEEIEIDELKIKIDQLETELEKYSSTTETDSDLAEADAMIEAKKKNVIPQIEKTVSENDDEEEENPRTKFKPIKTLGLAKRLNKTYDLSNEISEKDDD